MEKVIVEYIDEEEPNKVAVYPYDSFSKTLIESPEVMDYNEAKRNYEIIGTIIDGEIELDDNMDDDYDDYQDYDDLDAPVDDL